jgi:hypothetical protein
MGGYLRIGGGVLFSRITFAITGVIRAYKDLKRADLLALKHVTYSTQVAYSARHLAVNTESKKVGESIFN